MLLRWHFVCVRYVEVLFLVDRDLSGVEFIRGAVSEWYLRGAIFWSCITGALNMGWWAYSFIDSTTLNVESLTMKKTNWECNNEIALSRWQWMTTKLNGMDSATSATKSVKMLTLFLQNYEFNNKHSHNIHLIPIPLVSTSFLFFLFFLYFFLFLFFFGIKILGTDSQQVFICQVKCIMCSSPSAFVHIIQLQSHFLRLFFFFGFHQLLLGTIKWAQLQ